MENPDEIKKKLWDAAEKVSPEDWKLIANLNDDEAEQFQDMFKAIFKLQPPVQKAAHVITRCCADIALSFCTYDEKHEICYRNKHLRKTLHFLSTLIQELKEDFDQQIAEQNDNK